MRAWRERRNFILLVRGPQDQDATKRAATGTCEDSGTRGRRCPAPWRGRCRSLRAHALARPEPAPGRGWRRSLGPRLPHPEAAAARGSPYGPQHAIVLHQGQPAAVVADVVTGVDDPVVPPHTLHGRQSSCNTRWVMDAPGMHSASSGEVSAAMAPHAPGHEPRVFAHAVRNASCHGPSLPRKLTW